MFFQLQNSRRRQKNNGVRKALSWIITQISAMTAVSSSNKAAGTGLKKAVNMIITQISRF